MNTLSLAEHCWPVVVYHTVRWNCFFTFKICSMGLSRFSSGAQIRNEISYENKIVNICQLHLTACFLGFSDNGLKFLDKINENARLHYAIYPSIHRSNLFNSFTSDKLNIAPITRRTTTKSKRHVHAPFFSSLYGLCLT